MVWKKKKKILDILTNIVIRDVKMIRYENVTLQIGKG